MINYLGTWNKANTANSVRFILCVPNPQIRSDLCLLNGWKCFHSVFRNTIIRPFLDFDFVRLWWLRMRVLCFYFNERCTLITPFLYIVFLENIVIFMWDRAQNSHSLVWNCGIVWWMNYSGGFFNCSCATERKAGLKKVSLAWFNKTKTEASDNILFTSTVTPTFQFHFLVYFRCTRDSLAVRGNHKSPLSSVNRFFCCSMVQPDLQSISQSDESRNKSIVLQTTRLQ